MTDVTIHVDRHPTEPRFLYRCGWTSDGIAWDPQGCEHRTPKEAARHVDELKDTKGWGREDEPTDWNEEPIHD